MSFTAMRIETDLSKHRFPGIARATLEMSHANGGVNRDRREKEVLTELEPILAECDLAMDLPAISEWLSKLPDEDMLTLVDGEESDQHQIVTCAPHGADSLLNLIFDNVA
jgi:hypothetical protein